MTGSRATETSGWKPRLIFLARWGVTPPKEKLMKTQTCMIRGGVVMVICLFAIVWAAVPGGAAQSSQGSGEEQVKLVGHLALPGIHVNSMFTQSRNGKYYLFLHRPTRQAFALVDVSKPDKPVLLEKATLTEAPLARVDVNPANPTLAIAVAPEEKGGTTAAQTNSGEAAPAVVLPTETVRLVDLSDPKHPKTLKTFTGVTSMLPDDARRLIYIVNHEGLWVVRHQQSHPMPLCTTEDALIQAPNCQ
jgi:hypothetical protein